MLKKYKQTIMAKRGRKPKNERRGYFYETEENAVVEYIQETDQEKREYIFNTYLLPAFTKMIESIIRRYKLYLPDEDFSETFDDTISFLMSKIDHFNPNSGYKAYSYCGTICKNYLILKINKYDRNQKRNVSYDYMLNDLREDGKYSYEDNNGGLTFLQEIINETSNAIQKIMSSGEKLNQNEVKVGEALVALMNNWEELFARMGSDKFNKSSILLYLKETTYLSTKEIRKSMRKYKDAYLAIKERAKDEQ